MPFCEKTQRLRHLRNGFSESARNSELETIFKPFGLRHVIKSGSSHSLDRQTDRQIALFHQYIIQYGEGDSF